MIAWGLHALTDFNLLIPGTVMTLIAMPLLFLDRVQTPALADTAVPHGKQALRIVAAIAVGAIGATAIFGAASRVPGERAHQKLSAEIGEPDVNYWQAQKMALTAAEKLPESPYPHLAIARLAESKKLHRFAAKALQAALDRTPHRGSLWYALARNRLLSGDIAAAREALKKGVEWHPHDEQRPMIEEALKSQPHKPLNQPRMGGATLNLKPAPHGRGDFKP
jgi:tetratricopeptide (TPR) repeat protein